MFYSKWKSDSYGVHLFFYLLALKTLYIEQEYLYPEFWADISGVRKFDRNLCTSVQLTKVDIYAFIY